ncbi:hypothetical protein SD71_21685 [Cohnella kolymensis]|uniref:Haloacid dehalogenase n=2 Tax=Cohnella kolymensis TaxID=1590652 RepID=A0ABR4ZZN3_9BACL|nr:hypothetical protein SD71_21685 [Cohnella kolymensis]
MRIKGVIFDMDNTLLQSRIDFHGMKSEIHKYLVELGVAPSALPLQKLTTSMLIDQAVLSGRMDAASMKQMWNIAKKYEIAGMKNAELEPGARKLLDFLKDKLRLVVVTNNSGEAAETALSENGISSYFDLVVGREFMGRMKPEPDGFVYVAEKFREELAVQDWLAVGDSWIDRQASEAAGIEFVAYRPEADKWNAAGVQPGNSIDQWSEFFHYLK